MDIAIVTGASSGLGEAFFEELVKRYADLDEIWVIARREAKLRQLAEAHPEVSVRVLALDLSDSSSFDVLESALAQANPNVRALFNNAGFDCAGLFRDMDPSDIRMLVELNALGTTMVSRACLPHMQRGSYQIIVGSIGSFAPLPWRAAYSASKAYVRFLTRALREEERKRDVNVMLLSPGNMKTEMFDKESSGGKLSFFPYLDLKKVSVRAMERAERGAGAYTPHPFYKAYRALSKIVPSAAMTKFTSVEGSLPNN